MAENAATRLPDTGGRPPHAPPPAPPTRRRRVGNLIIDKRLQLRFVIVVALISTMISLVLGYLIWNQRTYATQTIVDSIDAVDWINPALKSDIKTHLHTTDVSVILRMAGVCLGLMAVMSLFLIVMTHKVAGPLHKVSLYLDEMAHGALPVVRAHRKWDLFQDFYKKFKDMGWSMRTRAEADVELYDRFLAAAGEAGASSEGELGHALDELRRLKAEKEAALAAGTGMRPVN